MKSPGTELGLTVGYLAALNLLRNAGPADGDTISEITRGVVRRVPHGPVLFRLALHVGAEAFHRHICKPT